MLSGDMIGLAALYRSALDALSAVEQERDRLRGALEYLASNRLIENCVDTFLGGYGSAHDIDVFRHGMGTVAAIVRDGVERALHPDTEKEPQS
jgi:hypothetical protein